MLDLSDSRWGLVVGTCVHVEKYEISELFEDLLALQELVWPVN